MVFRIADIALEVEFRARSTAITLEEDVVVRFSKRSFPMVGAGVVSEVMDRLYFDM